MGSCQRFHFDMYINATYYLSLFLEREFASLSYNLRHLPSLFIIFKKTKGTIRQHHITWQAPQHDNRLTTHRRAIRLCTNQHPSSNAPSLFPFTSHTRRVLLECGDDKTTVHDRKIVWASLLVRIGEIRIRVLRPREAFRWFKVLILQTYPHCLTAPHNTTSTTTPQQVTAGRYVCAPSNILLQTHPHYSSWVLTRGESG